jgi:RIO kinase 1
MQFIGELGFPAPLLKDATINESQARTLYMDSVKIVWRIYNKARLVHADLSEFNMLYSFKV